MNRTSTESDAHPIQPSILDEMGREVRESLSERPRRLDSKYFYDRRGSDLFEQITQLPEYYLTRTERALLLEHAGRIARISQAKTFVELGSGSALKTRLLIDALIECGTLERFVPVEVSESMALEAAERLRTEFPSIQVEGFVADFVHKLGTLPVRRHQLIALLGSTLGNFSRDEAIRMLADVPHLIQADGFLLLGVDLIKDPAVLEAAYNDSAGVTAEFNLNILNVINREFGANFNVEKFEHVSRYNSDEARIESSLRTKVRQQIRIPSIDLQFELQAGEVIATEVSCKYSRESIERLLGAAGLSLEHWMTDEQERFALILASSAI